jgi:hypothetical protein
MSSRVARRSKIGETQLKGTRSRTAHPANGHAAALQKHVLAQPAHGAVCRASPPIPAAALCSSDGAVACGYRRLIGPERVKLGSNPLSRPCPIQHATTCHNGCNQDACRTNVLQ